MATESRDGIGAKGLKTKLIVNYLPQSMKDNEFRALFADIGHLDSYRLMRDKTTNYSFGYGFIDYLKPEDAVAAITKLDGKVIQNKTLRVAYSKPPGSSKNVNLYVSGLAPQTNELKLEELFGVYGDIVQTKVLRDSNGSSRGIGFVLFKEKPHADAALRALQGYSDGYGLKLQMKYAKDSSEQQRSHPKFQEYMQQHYQAANQNQFQSATRLQVSYDAGLSLMSYGEERAYSDNELGSGYGGGYGGITYAAPETSYGMGGQKALRGGRGGARFNPIARPIGTNGIGLSLAGGVVQDTPAVVLFVYNIGPDATESDLYGLFSKFGRIIKVNVIEGKGYGFVHMPIPYEASEAARALNGLYYNGKQLQVSVKSQKK